jgi:hypothetical protein
VTTMPSPASSAAPRTAARLLALALPAVCALVAAGLLEGAEADAPKPPAPGARATVIQRASDPSTWLGQQALRDQRVGRQHTPSPLLLPDQQLPLRFSHELHVSLLECRDCHASVYGSVRARDVNLPPEATCFDCHDAAAAAAGAKTDPPASCDTCHPGYMPEWLPGADFHDTSKVREPPPPIVIPEPHIRFNHRVHVERGVTCETCHGDMSEVALATRDNALPVMETCIGCHDGKEASDACRTCHETQPDGRLRQDFPNGKLMPAGHYFMDAHDEDWLYSHRAVATLGDSKCESCHTQKYCLDCHNGVQKPLKVHPNNWINQHAIPARKNSPDCASCHRSQTYCVDCHTATKVTAYTRDRDGGARPSFHPEGWVTFGRRGMSHHAFEAQRNIRACASCHTEASCIACHATAGIGANINPHPPGWARSEACVRMRNKNERACYKCHQPMDPAMRCDR